MIYSIVLGVILGVNHVAFVVGIPVLLGLVALKGLVDILMKKNFITGSPSPYVLYLEKLGKSEPIGRHVWRGYLFQMVLFGGFVGLAGYGVCYFIF